MFVVPMNTLAVEVLRNSLNPPPPGLAELDQIAVQLEYPIAAIHVPGVWVNFTSMGDVRVSSIGQSEYEVDSVTGSLSPIYRWSFAGTVEATCVALTNLERARLVDEVSKVIGMGGQENELSPFRMALHTNDLLAVNAKMGSLTISGFAETPGTPWGSDDVVYEATISLDVEGEVFVSAQTQTLVPLSEIRLHYAVEGEPLYPEGGTEGWV